MRRLLYLLVLAAALSACSTERGPAEPAQQAGAGGGGAGGTSGGASGHGGTPALDAGAASYHVVITAERDVLCPGECTELRAEAFDGRAPYVYAWQSPSARGQGPHEVCPSETTRYAVTASDTPIESEELSRPSQSASSELEIRVRSTSDPACADDDGGTPQPRRETVELCAIPLRYEDPRQVLPGAIDPAGSRLATDAEGNAYVAGTFSGSFDFGDGFVEGPSNYTGYVAKYSAECELLWYRLFGDVAASVELFALAAGPSGALAVGGRLRGLIAIGTDLLVSSEPYWSGLLMSLDAATGEPLWGTALASPMFNTVVWQVAIDGDGDVVFSGSAQGSLPIAGQPIGPADAYGGFVARVSREGAELFGRLLEGAISYQRLAVSRAGDVAVSSMVEGDALRYGDSAELAGRAQRFALLLDAGGELIWSHAFDEGHDGSNVFQFGASGIALDEQRTVWVEHGNFSLGQPDPLIVPERVSRFSASGTIAWTRDVSPARWQPNTTLPAGTIAVDSAGELVHTDEVETPDEAPPPGTNGVPNDVHVQKLAGDGSVIWRHVLSTDAYERVWGLAIAPDDAIWVGHGVNLAFGGLSGSYRITKLAP